MWAPVSKKCTNSGALDAGHLIPEFAVNSPWALEGDRPWLLMRNKLIQVAAEVRGV